MKRNYSKKELNKQISVFNNKLIKALKKGNIDKNTYTALLIDKPKKDYYREMIYTKKQFNFFKNTLKKANEKTLKITKRQFKNIGENLNELAKTAFEKKILQQQLKKQKYLKDTFGHRFSDYIMDVAIKNDKEKYYKLFNRILKMDYEVENKDKRYIENWKKAYKQRFGKRPKYQIDDPRIIKEMLKNPNLAIDNFYDPFKKDPEVKEDVDTNIKEIKKQLKKGGYVDDDEINIDELINY